MKQFEPPGAITLTGIQNSNEETEEYLSLTKDGDIRCKRTSTKLADYAAKHKIMSESDLIMLVTGRKMLCMTPRGEFFPVRGVTRRKVICKKDKVILVSDLDAAELSISYISAAHEVAHSLGSPHDGAETSKACSAKALLLMTPAASRHVKSIASACTKKVIAEFLKTQDARCLFEQKETNLSP
ncbi:venom metalloproteinase antarease-like TtrivMP_A [Dermacentor variabilis]|uniref:venom metalloproteinase antarease-like TtrivMP_A n=1 Tax=Dermacentor variabilis TaxID=34621 RepID=UPI003F5B1BF9